MGKILLLENILDTAVQNEREQYLLFGLKDYIKLNEIHDFIFHYTQAIPYGRFPTKDLLLTIPDLLVIPVLPYALPEDKDDAKVRMVEIYGQNSMLRTFAVRDHEQKKLKTKYGKIEHRDRTLKFYELTKDSLGIEFNELGDYYFQSEGDVARYMPNWHDINEQLSVIKASIDKHVQELGMG